MLPERRTDLTADRARALLSYNPATGEFRWRRAMAMNRIPAGSVAGHISLAGYRVINVDGVLYYAQRLAWLMQTGCFPASDMDHRNGRRDDNRWSNLRMATRSQNCANSKRRKDNSTGEKGVALIRGTRWRATIRKDRKRHHLGYFDTKEKAAAAYREAAVSLFGQHARFA